MNKADYQRSNAAQRGPGRLEQRTYFCFKINPLALAPRWKDACFGTVIQVKQLRKRVDGSQPGTEVSYFLSNAEPTNLQEANDLFDAIRHH
ncbi:hypothetical protein GO730_09285 [Spirosoma sp. HMF3257]|uniref:Uncharacterized protein n=1 Tax=Spirosoma telluris TaxID=2183553 RepID=A0A327NGD2_9BACT|nr:hypothetical protein [Spirosoma telluris]RAI74420.1 hypothetical protein HMF3257_09195 [Spirosoma telluris]